MNVFVLKINGGYTVFILEADIADNIWYFSVVTVILKKSIGYHLFGETKETKDGLL